MRRRATLTSNWYKREALVMLIFLLFPLWSLILMIVARALAPQPLTH